MLFSACATTPQDQAQEEQQEADTYRQAMEEARAGNYETAIAKLEGIKSSADSDETRFRADISIAYVLYKKGDYDKAMNACDEILKGKTKGADVSYVYYLQGLIASGKGQEKLDKLMESMSVDSRYPDELRDAYRIFTQLVQDYPESAYTDDAVRRTEELRNQLAQFELHVAKAELVQGKYDDVIRHTRYINEYFPDPEIQRAALVLMQKAYQQSGRQEEAERVGRQINSLGSPADL
jgi:outer membrane protein assembly factor BamD